MNDNNEYDPQSSPTQKNKAAPQATATSSLSFIHRNVLNLLQKNSFFDKPRHKAELNVNANENEQNNPTMMADDENQQLHLQQQLLLERQRFRIFLASEVARLRSESDLSRMKAMNLTMNKQGTAINTSTFLEETAQELESLHASEDLRNQQILPRSNLAVSMQEIRKKRKLTAAYRLGGVTAAVPHADTEILSIRLDICMEGDYVACHHAFWDLIVEEDEKEGTLEEATKDKDKNDNDTSNTITNSSNNISKNNLYFRLVQHTIPSSVPLQSITAEAMGGFLFLLGDLHNKEQWRTEEFKRRIRIWCRQVHYACWCLARRKQVWNLLEQLQKGEQDAALRVTSLRTLDASTLDQISFQLSFNNNNGASSSDGSFPVAVVGLDIELNYENPKSGQPTRAQVESRVTSRATDNISHNHSLQKDPLSDRSDDEDANPPVSQELSRKAQQAFLDLPLPEALDQIKSMFCRERRKN